MRSYIECCKGTNARRTLASALPACAQQLTGLAFLGTYASLFFKQSGFTNPFLITTVLSELYSFSSLECTNLCTALIAIGTYIVAMLTSDKFGRRRIVLVSAIVSTVSMLVIGILGFVSKTPPLKNLLIFVACLWDFFNIARKL
jgi:SP family sugar:H+ symporter-like MFS transporter